MTENTDQNPIHSYTRHTSGPDALEAFLTATNKTPTVGQSIYEFTVRARNNREADNFVQAMRGALSKHRRKFKRKYGRKPQSFTMSVVSKTFDKESGLCLIALGRKQRGGLQETLNIEMLQLLTTKFTQDNSNWARMLEALKTKPEVVIAASDWDNLALAVILVYQQNAVYKRYDEALQSHVIGRT